jgi:hypothetical protein
MERDPETAIWHQPHLWTRAAQKNLAIEVENQAVQLTSEDPKLRFCPNCHTLWFASQSRLHDYGYRLHFLIRKEFEFDELHYWDAQREWLDQLVRDYFPTDSDFLGSISFLPMRRPAHLRTIQDSTIRVDQSPAQVNFRRLNNKNGSRCTIGDTRIRLDGLVLATPDVGQTAVSLAQAIVPRKVTSSRFAVSSVYREAWYCAADPREDRAKLIAGRLPAVPATQYEARLDRLRTSGIVNLVKVDPKFNYTIMAIEIDSISGKTLSIRWYHSKVATALLNSSPVEHLATEQALQRLAR